MGSNVIREDVVRIDFEGDAFDEIKKLQKQCNELRKRLGMVDDEPVEDVGDSAEKSNKSMERLNKTTSKVGNGLKKLASISLKGLTVGLGAAAAGVGKLSMSAVTAYADYEQLVGGVDTLFKDASGKVQSYANDAFKNTGMSANEYMQNVTSFSASLISSAGGDTAKAAELANMALVDMSDNANKMGTDLQMVVGTYQSIARGGYAMLDNLKLGYGGTKTELQRLIKDAAKLDKSVDANSMSYGNIVKAIHAVQTELGITGTTQLEAEKTITGSLNMVKSAWKNLMPALIQGGDSFEQCMENLLYSFDKFTDNAMPALEKALGGIGQLLTSLAPKLEKKFPVLMDKLLPPLIKAASSLLAGFIKALPDLIKTVAKEIPNIAQDMAKAIFEAFTGKEAAGIENGVKSLGNALKWLIPIVGGVVVAFKGLKAVQSIKGVFGGFGVGTGGGAGGKGGFLDGLSNIKFTTVLKGIAGMVLVVAALGGLLWLATKVFKNGIDFKEMSQVILLIGLLGGVGGVLSLFAGVVGNIPVPTVLMGLANIAIVIAGLGALLWVATKVFAGGVNFAEMFQLISLIGILGTVGTVLSIFAGIVGMIPIPVVLAGLANMALVIGGVSAIIAAFGGLSELPGFAAFIEKGGELLAKIFNIIGNAMGSLVGGAIEGISNALPTLGENLGKFGEHIKPLFSAMQGIDMGGAAAFFASLVGLLGIATGNEIVNGIKSFFGGRGESALVKMGSDLCAFAENAKPFFDTVQTIPEAAFTAAKNMFEALSSIGQLPGMGGLAQVFTGDPYLGMQAMSNLLPGLAASVNTFFATLGARSDFSAFSALFEALSAVGQLPGFGGLAQMVMGDPYKALLSLIGLLPLLGVAVAAFFTGLGERTDFSALPALFGALSAVSQLPSFGGLASLFMGDPYQALLAMAGVLPILGLSVSAFFAAIGDRTDFSAIPALFKALGSLGDYIDSSGGLFGAIGEAFTGSTENGLVKIGKALKQFGEDTSSFFANVNSLNVGNLNGLWASLKNAETISADVLAKTGKNSDTLVQKLKKLPAQMASAVRSGAGAFASAFAAMWASALSVSNGYVSRMISDVNRVTRQIRSVKQSVTGITYANGTLGHPGGNAIVNDGRGAELVRMPNGNAFIPQGRNVFLPNAPKGMQVLTASQTASVMGKSTPTFHYAGGTNAVSAASTNISNGGDTYAPVFNLTISGSGDDRAMARRVKRWVEESMNEMFESMSRKSPRVREV